MNARMPDNKRKRKSGKRRVDAVEVQVAIQVPRIFNKKISQKLLNEVLMAWADTGDVPRGFHINSVEWENYARGKERRIAADVKSIEKARTTLNLGALFRGRFARISSVRKAKGNA